MRTDARLWILGAADPEMGAIESLLIQCGESVVYSAVEDGFGGFRRAHAGEVSRSDQLTVIPCHDAAEWLGAEPALSTVYTVECAFPEGMEPRRHVQIDHHRPGDPGYGRPPAEFLAASSIGQVIAELARLDLWPRGGDGAEPIGDSARCAWIEEIPGDRFSARWIVLCHYDGREHMSPYAVIPHRFVFAAAADHCLGAAYRGECPGVEPDALMRWRAESRAAFQGRSVGEVLADVEAAQAELSRAPGIWLRTGCERCESSGRLPTDDLVCGDAACCGYATRDCPDCGGHPAPDVVVRDMRRPEPIAELPEAATRLGVGYVSGPLIGPDGLRKYTVSGTPEQVRAWLDHWAPAQGLTGLYGDPARGFAGGYEEETGAGH